MSRDPRLADLMTGMLAAQLFIMETLIRKGAVQREDLINDLQALLTDFQTGTPPAPPGMQLPAKHLIRGLSDPTEPRRRQGWTPVVIDGGGDQEEP